MIGFAQNETWKTTKHNFWDYITDPQHSLCYMDVSTLTVKQ
jgi:hypothetical protein